MTTTAVRRRPPARLPVWRSPIRLVGATLTWLLVAFNLLMFVWIVLASFKDTREIFGSPWALPSMLHLENYVTTWVSSELATSARNSILLVAAAAATVAALGAPAAYALSRFKVRFSGALSVYFVLGMGIPAQATIIPMYVGMAKLHMIDSLTGLYLLYVAVSLPFTVFLLTGFFRGLPDELEEAAAIDGSSPLHTFVHIMLPLARPGIITASIVNIIALWNETFLALVFLQDNAKYTLSLAILNMYGTMQYTSNWGGLFAGVCMVILPMLLMYVFLGRRIIDGLTFGSGK